MIPTECQEMIDDCMERESRLSEWEANFLESIENQLAKKGDLSDKQKEILERIW